jgi:toxin CcdB
MQTLTPAIRVEGKSYLVITPQLAGVATRELGLAVVDAPPDRPAIIAALDFLISGI